jgi:hypothetical protein
VCIKGECDVARRVVFLADFIDELLDAASSISNKNKLKLLQKKERNDGHHDTAITSTDEAPQQIVNGGDNNSNKILSPWEKVCEIVYGFGVY